MRKLSVCDQIVTEIRKRIAKGKYAPGGFMPTERQLAREFQTSPTTVSRALFELRENGLIEQAPGRGTRVLSLSERRTAGAVVIVAHRGDPVPPSAARMVQGAQVALSQLNQHFELMYLASSEAGSFSAESAAQRYAGALFMQGMGVEPEIFEMERCQFPYVVANLEKPLDLTCTWVDHGKTTRAATRFLAALGHRRIALITRRPEMFFYQRACAGYQAALQDAGMAFDPSLHIIAARPEAIDAYLATRDFLSRNAPPTAVVAARDYLANGACRALEEKGLRIGRDVSVIGFDDSSWRQEKPFLTTFREPNFELGAQAATMLVERLISGWKPVEKREIEAPLVMRRSVGLGPDPLGEDASLQFLMRPSDEFGVAGA